MTLSAEKLVGGLPSHSDVTVAVQDLATSEQHPPLLPPHPAVRARARIIMDHFNTHFVPLFYRILVRYKRPRYLNVSCARDSLTSICGKLRD